MRLNIYLPDEKAAVLATARRYCVIRGSSISKEVLRAIEVLARKAEKRG